MLTELALILCSVMASAALAAAVARAAFRPSPTTSDLRRLTDAAARASDAFLWRANKSAGLAALVMALLVLAAQGYRATSGAEGALARAAWTITGLAAGTLGTAIVAYVAAGVVLRAAAQAAAEPTQRAESVVLLSVRAGGVLGLTADAASTALVAALFALPFFLQGGSLPDRAHLGPLLETAAAVLPGVGIGAALAALVTQQAGSTYHACANVGGNVGAEVHAGLAREDARNPALVAGLVGNQVGLAAGRAVDVFVLGTLSNVAAWMVGVGAFAESNGGSWGLLSLPLVARVVGSLSSVFGLLTARADAGEAPAAALWRGQVAASIVAIGGVGGAALWLLGEPWLYVTGAAATGIVGFGLTAHSARWLGREASSPARELAESSRVGPAITVARALAEGMAATWLPIVGLAVSTTAAWHVAAASGAEGAGLVGVSTALAGAVGISVYASAMSALSPVSRACLALRAVTRRAPTPDERRESQLLDGTALEVSTVSQTYFAMLGPAAAIFAVAALPAGGGGAEGLSPAIVGAGLLGACTVLAFAGRTLAVGSRAARAAASEVERQLKGFPRGAEGIDVPESFTPTYRILVDQASKVALTRILAPIGLAAGTPLALGIALRLLYSSERLAIVGLSAFVVIASATGLATALTVDATRAVLGAAHRSNLPRGTSPGFQTSAEGDALADLVGTTATPASLLLTKTLATAALVVAPLLS